MTFTNIASIFIYNCYYRFLVCLGMPSKKSKKKFISTNLEANNREKATPRTAKIVLFVFGIGPLLLMSLFLFSNGFFNSP